MQVIRLKCVYAPQRFADAKFMWPQDFDPAEWPRCIDPVGDEMATLEDAHDLAKSIVDDFDPTDYDGKATDTDKGKGKGKGKCNVEGQGQGQEGQEVKSKSKGSEN